MLARADSASLFWLCFRSAFLCTASGLSTVTVLYQQDGLDAAPNTYLQEKQLPFVEGSEFTKISLAGKKDLQTQFQAFWIYSMGTSWKSLIPETCQSRITLKLMEHRRQMSFILFQNWGTIPRCCCFRNASSATRTSEKFLISNIKAISQRGKTAL